MLPNTITDFIINYMCILSTSAIDRSAIQRAVWNTYVNYLLVARIVAQDLQSQTSP